MPGMAFRTTFESDMKVPVRPAPLPPAAKQSLYSPVTNWEDNLFAEDVFEPTPNSERKKPPPRPPPPKIAAKPDIPFSKPPHFVRKPTILGALLTRKSRNECASTMQTQQQTANNSQMVSGKSVSSSSSFSSQSNMFSSTSSKKITSNTKSSSVQVASLIDISSPPESPTFTTRSSSDGLSIDSFGSDATSSTNNHFVSSGGGNISQAESGFEDDFELFSSNRSTTKDDSIDGWVNFDPFSPAQLPKKTTKKPVITNGEYLDPLCNGKTILPAVQTHKVPTIIRAKPARPKPPENSLLLKSSFTSVTAPPVNMNLNMAKPIQKTNTGVSDFMSSSKYSDPPTFDLCVTQRDSSPPMPTMPPPPPPVIEEEEDTFVEWPSLDNEAPTPMSTPNTYTSERIDVLESDPYGYSVYAYYGDQDGDLNFDENVKIKLLRKINDEWMYGRLKSGVEGMFPANYVDVKIPLPETMENHSNKTTGNTETYHNRKAKALYHFVGDEAGDLPLTVGCDVTILNKVNNEWYYGERNGQKGQFPANYVQIC